MAPQASDPEALAATLLEAERAVVLTGLRLGGPESRDLTHAAIRLAKELNVPALFLLTTTAERYFPQFGFERIARTDVPATVQTSIEFTSACPASAAVMRKPL